MSAQSKKRHNPFVGPRAYKYGETLYGRDPETFKLIDLLIAERIVLLESPSGAGKTSLIQASLIPKLQEKKFQVLQVMRVNHEPPSSQASANGFNRYLWSVLTCLEEELPDEKKTPFAVLAGLEFSTYLDQHSENTPTSESQVLIFDQFEEILTQSPTDRAEKQEFFRQVGAALRNRHRWALFSMREEFLSGLSPYLRPVPTRLSNRYRLELLGEDAARLAIQEPARQEKVTFSTAAAKKVVDDLRSVRIQQPDGTILLEPGLYIEPVQLQVVCHRLWNRLPEDISEITVKDVEDLGDVNNALADYYQESLKEIAESTKVRERTMREWFDRELITKHGIRGQILQGLDQSQGLENRAIWELVSKHLVRAEKRRGATWFELAHDRLIEPVQANNAAWFQENLSVLQKQALLWEDQERLPDLLLKGPRLAEAEVWVAEHSQEMTSIETAFIKACRRFQVAADRDIQLARRIWWLKTAISFSALLLLIVVSSVAYSLWLENRPWGCLIDLSSGKAYKLNGELVTLGRSVQDFKNQITFRPQNISRMHLYISRQLAALDMRSRNGTTLNSMFLPYGKSEKLKDGDIVVLAGLAALQFEEVRYRPMQFWPPDIKNEPPPSGWGLFIDGKAKRITNLTKDEYFICLDHKGKYIVSESRYGPIPLMTIKKRPDGEITLEDEDDAYELTAIMKEGDYNYVSYPIPPKRAYGWFRPKAELHDIFEVAYRYQDSPFQIIPIVPDLEGETSTSD